MSQIDKALQRVQFHTFDGHSTALAIHKAAQDTGLPVSDISAEMNRRKESKKTRAAYRSTVPAWQRAANDR
jgi:hypothetical protein